MPASGSPEVKAQPPASMAATGTPSRSPAAPAADADVTDETPADTADGSAGSASEPPAAEPPRDTTDGVDEPATPSQVEVIAAVNGSVSYYPLLGIDPEPVENIIAADYFMTTDTNTTLRRGLIEFAPSDFEAYVGDMEHATLVLEEGGGWTALHRVSRIALGYYPADLAITVEDYDRAVTPVAVFEATTDVASERWEFDVTEIVAAAAPGESLGFRIQLEDDVPGRDWWGAGIAGRETAIPPRLVIVSSPE